MNPNHKNPADDIDADIVILGGGLVGLSMALAFGDSRIGAGLRVALVDNNTPDIWSKSEFDGRASAITAASRTMLEALGVWPDVADHAQPMRDIIVTDSRPGDVSRPVLLKFEPARGRGDVAAHMVENVRLGSALADRVAATETVVVIAPDRATGFKRTPSEGLLELESGRTLRAPLVIAADGRRSWLRGVAGIDTVGWRYDQSGIVATVIHDRPHDGVAQEHFMPAGPFAVLPLTGNRSSLVWTEETGDATRIVGLDDTGFAEELRRRFDDRLGAFEARGPRWAYPLEMMLARDYACERVALVGDAAHSVHPLAGLGFNLGLRDVAALSEVCVDGLRLGMDPGSLSVLDRYTTWRRPDNVATAFAMDGLNRLFSNDNPALKAIRDMGLGLVDRLPQAKGFFVNEAAGLGGALPKLLRGDAL